MPGQVTLGKLRIKKGVLDSLRLPIDVTEGEYRHYHRGAFVNVEEQAIWESSPCLCIGLTWEISLFKY